MDDLLDALDRVRTRRLESPRDAELSEEAARLTRELMAAHEKAERFIREALDRVVEQGATPLKGLTLHEAARRVLADAGVPLHARELGLRIKAGGWEHPRSRVARPDQIVFQLAARLPRHPDVFKRVAPNTFALAEWGPERFKRKRQSPKFALFRGPGESIGAAIGGSDEPFSSAAPWRSS